jgi:uncharacterized membrane protein
MGVMSGLDEETTSREAPRLLRTQRLEAFSDGVFAIAITLLVLNVAVRAGWQRDLLGAFLGQWPTYLAYVVSFATVGALWLGHSLVTEYLQRADAILMRLNLLLLLVVSFLPFPTPLLAEYLSSDHAEQVAVTIYGLTLLLAAALLSRMWRYALREHLVRPDAADTAARDGDAFETLSLFADLGYSPFQIDRSSTFLFVQSDMRPSRMPSPQLLLSRPTLSRVHQYEVAGIARATRHAPAAAARSTALRGPSRERSAIPSAGQRRDETA